MYMKVFGHQATTYISPGQNVPHIMVILVQMKKKNPFLNKKVLLKILYNTLIICKQFLVLKK